MTNEEAIKSLKNLKSFNNYGTALELDIKALEQESKTGHWIEEEVFDGELGYRCSECGELFWLENGTPKDNEYNFCPKCGADMRGEEE